MLDIWKKAPALYLGFSLLFGSVIHIYPSFTIALIAFVFTLLGRTKALPFAFLFLLQIFNAELHTPQKITETKGIGYFVPQMLRQPQSPFTSGLTCHGRLRCFQPKDTSKPYFDLPCTLLLPVKNRPKINSHFLVEGSIASGKTGVFIKLERPLEPIEKTYSFAEKRFHLKRKIKAKIKKQINDHRVYSLLSALSTAEQQNNLLSWQFGELGLKHTLAISGFHYGWLALTLSLFLRLVLPSKFKAIVVLIALFAFFLYIGESPSMKRAWIAASLFLIGYLFNLRIPPLNALGLALMVALIVDPLIVVNIGFQLSYLATFALLTYLQFFEESLSKILPIRSALQRKAMRKFDQKIYLISACIRKTLALTLAVHLLTLPLLLFHFQHFPLLSLIYNLFFPLALIPTMFILILSMACPIPILFTLNEMYTKELLILVEFFPKALAYHLHISSFNPLLLAVTLSSFALFGLYKTETKKS